jgi:prevent-host-death family protein
MTHILLNDVNAKITDLMNQALSGEEIIIIKDNNPVIKISPIKPQKSDNIKSGFGGGKDDIIYISNDFDEIPAGFEEYL